MEAGVAALPFSSAWARAGHKGVLGGCSPWQFRQCGSHWGGALSPTSRGRFVLLVRHVTQLVLYRHTSVL